MNDLFLLVKACLKAEEHYYTKIVVGDLGERKGDLIDAYAKSMEKFYEFLVPWSENDSCKCASFLLQMRRKAEEQESKMEHWPPHAPWVEMLESELKLHSDFQKESSSPQI